MSMRSVKKSEPKKKPSRQKAPKGKQSEVKPLRRTAAEKKSGSKSLALDIVTILRKGKPKAQQERIQLLSEGPALSKVTEWIPTLFPAVDSVIGGGLAVGRISEVFGPEGAGKSAFTHMCSKGCQSIGGTVVFLDFEAALDPEKTEQLNIDPSRLVYSVPATVEDGIDAVKALVMRLQEIKPDAPVLIVWDSVAAAPTAEEKSKSASDVIMPHKAKMMGRAAREMMLELQKARAHLLYVNQEREVIGGAPFQEPNVPGGKGIKYASSQRIRVQRVKSISQTKNKKKNVVSYIVKLTTRKCRLTPPHQKVELILDFRYGLSPEATMLHHLVNEGVAKNTKGKITLPWFEDDHSIPERAWVGVLKDDKVLRKEVEKLYAPVAKAANWINVEPDSPDDEDEQDPLVE